VVDGDAVSPGAVGVAGGCALRRRGLSGVRGGQRREWAHVDEQPRHLSCQCEVPYRERGLHPGDMTIARHLQRPCADVGVVR
jgi:hypothetical protein